ncbi:MAG: flagellar biosynthesis protein FlgA [Candidatus Pacebacteria bacterium RIFOXYA1_FULL_38_18]|nr:MAG: flagellar biosynthesis protein FlgA [Candidatus Pacebacteria bacterium RIFOXYA1_FULL_38_18]OGJ39572.1 MAG: flagellar biosynthesis protein FlgA [Candidatus Pacebacteria bacterium RIFOXYC1_FULL_39_21]
MKNLSFLKEIKIGKRKVGINHPAYIVVDAGANFNNNLDTAKKLAYEAKKAGADVIKYQSFLAKKIVSARGFDSMELKGVHGSWDQSVEEVFKKAELPRKWHLELANYCKNIGIEFTSSPYDFEAVDLLDEIGVSFFKIGSGDITWHEMLRYIAKKNKPIALATGASTLAEVDEAIRVIEETGNKKLILLQCITNYPSKVESANLNVMKTYSQAFDILTGYSDHSPGDTVVLGSIALGGCFIEKHFTLNKKDTGPDHPHSMEPKELAEMIKKIRDLEKAMGSHRKIVVPEESETVIVQRRSLYANTDIKKGQKILKRNLSVLRPALGILPKFQKEIVGRIANKNIEKGSPIKWDYLK